jgi:hypothetical protein
MDVHRLNKMMLGQVLSINAREASRVKDQGQSAFAGDNH